MAYLTKVHDRRFERTVRVQHIMRELGEPIKVPKYKSRSKQLDTQLKQEHVNNAPPVKSTSAAPKPKPLTEAQKKKQTELDTSLSLIRNKLKTDTITSGWYQRLGRAVLGVENIGSARIPLAKRTKLHEQIGKLRARIDAEGGSTVVTLGKTKATLDQHLQRTIDYVRKEQAGTTKPKVDITTNEAPKVQEPVAKVEEPKVEEPIAKPEAPKVEEPVAKVEEPTPTPKVEEPKVEEPKVEEPKVAEPVVKKELTQGQKYSLQEIDKAMTSGKSTSQAAKVRLGNSFLTEELPKGMVATDSAAVRASFIQYKIFKAPEGADAVATIEGKTAPLKEHWESLKQEIIDWSSKNKAKKAPVKEAPVKEVPKQELTPEDHEANLLNMFKNLAKDEGGYLKVGGWSVKNIRQKLTEVETKRTAQLKQRMKDRKFKFFSGVDAPGMLKDLEDVVVIGAIKIANKGLQFAEWSAEMLKDLGPKVKPHLSEIWGRSNQYLRQSFTKSQVAGQTEKSFVPTFYSQLKAAIVTHPQEKMTAEQLTGLIKSKGVPADELKWTGFDDWLAGKKGQKITKQEVVDFLDANDICIEEVQNPSTIDAYSTYTLDKHNMQIGKNYHNLVLVYAPKPKKTIPLNELKLIETYYSNRRVWDVDINTLPEHVNGRIIRNAATGTDKYTIQVFASQYSTSRTATSFAEAKKSLVDMLPKAYPKSFQSVHWPTVPNGLAHVRFADYVDAKGKRILLLEELQSDWHQAKRGAKANLKKALSEDSSAQKISAYKIALETILDAPFEKNWHELAMKRMLRYAAEHDYDGVAWTTGAQQNKRYNMDSAGKIDLYDTILPAFMNKYGKRWGIKVSTSKVHAKRVESPRTFIDTLVNNTFKNLSPEGKNILESTFTESSKKTFSTEEAITVLTTLRTSIKNHMSKLSIRTDSINEFGSLMEDARYLDEALEKINISKQLIVSEVHYAPITQEMKNSVLYEGQPMFTSPSNRPLDVVKNNPKFKKLWEVMADNKVYFKSPSPLEPILKKMSKAKNTGELYASEISELDGVNRSVVKEARAKMPDIPVAKAEELNPIVEAYKKELKESNYDFETAHKNMVEGFGKEKAQWVRDGYVGQAIDSIDAKAGSINARINDILAGRKLKDLSDDEFKEVVKSAKALDEVSKERDMLRPEVDRLTGKTTTATTKAILDKITNQEIALKENLTRAKYKGHDAGGDFLKLGIGPESEGRYVEVFLPDTPDFTVADEAKLSSNVGVFENAFGLVRDVLGDPVTDTMRKASTMFNAFAKGYEEILYDIVKPILSSPESRKRVYYLLEGKNIKASAVERKIANDLRDKVYNPLFKTFGIEGFVENYAPRIHKRGIWSEIASKEGMTTNRKAKFFADLERKGLLVPNDTDAITTALAYIRQGGKTNFVQPAFDAINARVGNTMSASRQAVYAKIQDTILMRPVWEQRLINTTIRKFGDALRKELGLSPNTKFDDFTTVMTRLIYTGTIAYNPMTALKNFTQMALSIGTLDGNIGTGVKYFAKAVRALRTEEGRKLLNYNWVGHSRQYLEGQEFQSNFLRGTLKSLETGKFGKVKLPNPFGMLQYTDKLNVNTSYMMKMLHALERNKSLAEAVTSANKFAGDTQFLYGGVDSPLLYKTSAGKLVGVLMSWPINFMRLINKTWQSNPNKKEATMKIANTIGGLTMLSYGLSQTGLDFSSTTPIASLEGWFPIAFAASESGSIPIETIKGGTQLVLAAAHKDPQAYDEAKKAMERNLTAYIPYSTQGKRLIKFFKAATNNWRVENDKGQLSYTMTPKEATLGLVGSTTESKERSREFMRAKREDYAYRKLREKAVQAYLKKDKEAFIKYQKELAKKYGKKITTTNIKQALKYNKQTAVERYKQGTPDTITTEKTASDYAREMAGLD